MQIIFIMEIGVDRIGQEGDLRDIVFICLLHKPHEKFDQGIPLGYVRDAVYNRTLQLTINI